VPTSATSAFVYLDTEDEELAQRVVARVQRLARVIGYQVEKKGRLHRGSYTWFTRLVAKLSKHGVPRRLAEAEQVARLLLLDEHQAKADDVMAHAVAQLLDSIAETPNACIRVGSLLILKFEDHRGSQTLVRQLTATELLALERYPGLQKDPSKTLELLATVVRAVEESKTLSRPR
jgi:hypothetical protein